MSYIFLLLPFYCQMCDCLKWKTPIPVKQVETLPFHKKVTNFEHSRPDPVRDQFAERAIQASRLDHNTKVQF